MLWSDWKEWSVIEGLSELKYSNHSPGGHLKPDPIYRAANVIETHGTEVAEHVSSFEARHADVIRNLVQRERIDCDFEETKVHDVCFYGAGRDQTKATLAKLVKANITTAKGVKYHSGTEAEEV